MASTAPDDDDDDDDDDEDDEVDGTALCVVLTAGEGVLPLIGDDEPEREAGDEPAECEALSAAGDGLGSDCESIPFLCNSERMVLHLRMRSRRCPCDRWGIM